MTEEFMTNFWNEEKKVLANGKAIPFSNEENDLVVRLYIENRDLYHERCGYGSKNGMSTMDRLASQWADELSQLGVALRSYQQVKRRILDLIKAAKTLIREETEQLARTGEIRRKRKEVPCYIRTLATFLSNDMNTFAGFDNISVDNGQNSIQQIELFESIEAVGKEVEVIKVNPLAIDVFQQPAQTPTPTPNVETPKLSPKDRRKRKRLCSYTIEELQRKVLEEELLFVEQKSREQRAFHEARMKTELMKQQTEEMKCNFYSTKIRSDLCFDEPLKFPKDE